MKDNIHISSFTKTFHERLNTGIHRDLFRYEMINHSKLFFLQMMFNRAPLTVSLSLSSSTPTPKSLFLVSPSYSLLSPQSLTGFLVLPPSLTVLLMKLSRSCFWKSAQTSRRASQARSCACRSSSSPLLALSWILSSAVSRRPMRTLRSSVDHSKNEVIGFILV